MDEGPFFADFLSCFMSFFVEVMGFCHGENFSGIHSWDSGHSWENHGVN